MSQSLEERLRANSNAFNGLLSLIPAKYYYDERTQDQWKAKRKTKLQSKQDKLKKLDPEQQNEETGAALDVLERRQKSAKPVKLPGNAHITPNQIILNTDHKEKNDTDKKIEVQVDESEDISESESINIIFDDEGNEIDLNNNHQSNNDESNDNKDESENEANLHKKRNLELLRAKLQAKIQNMRNKRKAPGTNVEGAPISREAILLQRKHKLELKQQRKLQQLENSESDTDDENDLDVESGPITKKMKKNNKGENDDVNADGVIYQSIMFNDGVRTTSDLQRLRKYNQNKKKGPSKHDYKAQLKILEQRKQKLQSKDELEQIKAIEKNKWQKAMLQAEGVKLKDDEKLIKKAIKRKEAKKRKSAIEWNERKRAVEANKQERVKRREENLKIRKENKGVKRSKQQKMKRKFKGIITPKKRAGLEGRLKRK